MAKKKKQLGGYVYPVNYVPQKKNGGWLDEFEDVPQAQFGINSFPTNVIIEKVAGLFGGDKYSRPDEIDIKDLRKIRKTTNKKIDPNSDLVSGKYDTRLIGEMLDQAKEFGISKEDAWNLAAIGLQESGWGKTDSNLGHVIGDISQGDTEHPFINAYLNKMKDADRLKITNPELRLQVYNGLGVVKPETEQNYHGFKMKKIYGVPVPKEGINMKKTPLYGRQIIDIRDNVLKKNPEVVKFVDSYYPEEKQYGGSVESTMGGLTDKGFNYNGAWGGPSMQMGGSMPGAVGFTYARTINPAPSKGKYAKKTMASAQNGQEMKFYQEGLDWTPKNISRDGSEIKKDDMGYWNPENWGKPVEIGSNEITMQGVDQPLIGVSDTGDVQMMYPGEDYTFDGDTVTEYPVMQKGGRTPIYVDSRKDSRLKAYQDSLSLYRQSLNNMATEGTSPDYKKLGFVSFNNAPITLSQPNVYEKNDRSYPSYESSRPSNKNEVFNEKIKPVGFDIRYIPRINSKQYSSVYKKPVQPVEYRKTDLPTLYVDDVNDPRLRAYQDSSFLSSRPRQNPNPMMSIQEWEKSRSSSAKNFKEKGIMPIGIRQFSEQPYRASEAVFAKPKQKVEYRKPQPKKEQPVKKQEQPKPVERKQNVYEGSPVYSGSVGSGMPSALIGFANQRGDTTYIKPEDYERFGVPKYGKEYIESKTTNKKKNGGWLDEFE